MSRRPCDIDLARVESWSASASETWKEIRGGRENDDISEISEWCECSDDTLNVSGFAGGRRPLATCDKMTFKNFEDCVFGIILGTKIVSGIFPIPWSDATDDDASCDSLDRYDDRVPPKCLRHRRLVSVRDSRDQVDEFEMDGRRLRYRRCTEDFAFFCCVPNSLTFVAIENCPRCRVKVFGVCDPSRVDSRKAGAEFRGVVLVSNFIVDKQTCEGDYSSSQNRS